jgi:hypothetical protein
MHRYIRALAAAALVALAVTAVAVASRDKPRPASGSGVAATQAATAKFQNVAVAKKAGYGLLKDKNGIACIAMDDMPKVGAMGVHYASNALVGDGTLKATTPEALVYEPLSHGKLRLAAVEYVVLRAVWDAAHPKPPVMFGQKLGLTPDGNRFGLPAFYSVHVWLYKYNPSGRFSMWNPRVHCAGLAAS